MYYLIDTFNSRIISKHRTLEAAEAADAKHQRDVKRHNGRDSYIPTRIEQAKKISDIGFLGR